MKMGDYVRIINTLESYVEIIKIKELNEYDGFLLDERNYQYSTDEIIKSNSNIIDLIEVGDYVNGLKITSINEPSMANCNKRLLYAKDEKGYLIKMFDEEDIKSIITKEQFENMEYKIYG